jgi:hypothetical protein
MVARARLWWQHIKRHPVGTVLSGLFAVAIVLIILSILGYIFNWHWTGLVPETSEPKQHAKTLWDWLQLLIIPAVLAVAGYVINLTISRGEQAATEQRAKSEREAAEKRAETERQIAKERYEQDQQIALDKQREDLLQAYLDRMSELLIKENLLTSPTKEVRKVATVRTISVLTQLDARRVGYVFDFLRESGLLTHSPGGSVIEFSRANLRNINWSKADLFHISLFEADLTGANLSGAELYGASLVATNLYKSKLRQAILEDADLTYTQQLHAPLAHPQR